MRRTAAAVQPPLVNANPRHLDIGDHCAAALQRSDAGLDRTGTSLGNRGELEVGGGVNNPLDDRRQRLRQRDPAFSQLGTNNRE